MRFTRRTYRKARNLALERLIEIAAQDSAARTSSPEFRDAFRAAKLIVSRGRREKGLWSR